MSEDTEQVSPTTSRCLSTPSPYPLYLSVVFYFLSYSTSSQLVSEAVIYNKVCYDHFNNHSLCSNTTFSKNHPALQKDAASWSVYVAAIQIAPAVLVNLILSSYCDKVGHKFPLAFSALSIMFSSMWLAVLATPALYQLPTALILLYGVCCAVFGGNPLMIMSSYSYITSVTPSNSLPVAMAVLEGAIEFGLLAGTLISGPLADHFGLENLAYLNIGLSALPTIIVLTVVVEIRRGSQANNTWRDAIGVKHIFAAVQCVFKRRPHYNRLLINLCYVSIYAVSIAGAGYSTLSFLYFVKEIGMTLTQLSVFSGYLMAVKGLGGPIILAISKKAKMDQMNMTMISCAGVALSYIIMSINDIPYNIWFGGILFAFQSVVYSLIRTFSVTLIERDEIGKIFAYDGICQVFFSLATVMVFKEFYSLTVVPWPSFFLALCALLCIVSMVVVACTSTLSSLKSS